MVLYAELKFDIDVEKWKLKMATAAPGVIEAGDAKCSARLPVNVLRVIAIDESLIGVWSGVMRWRIQRPMLLPLKLQSDICTATDSQPAMDWCDCLAGTT